MKSAMVMLMTATLFMVGCDREVSHETKVKDGPTGTKVEEKKTVEKADGTVETSKETKRIDK